MAVLWRARKPLPARAVRDTLASAGHDLAYNTVTTVLVRLGEKGLVVREKLDDVWQYAPSLSEAEFRARVSQEVLRRLLRVAPEATLAQLVDVLSEDEPEALEALERLIEKKRAARGGHT
ncbi:MAG: BlaI/MecI/CopY family transcriptional regulator [Gemmatimonadetes bacterium]|nr:BlaI/MecI/CopY family transcriptional regulator [Gemmatimonadota bacterium]